MSGPSRDPLAVAPTGRMSQPRLRWTSRAGRERPMAYEFPKGRPRSESLPPREDDEDQRAHNLARLHERIVEERLDPAFRAEGRRMEAPAVGGIQDHPRHLPDSIHEEVGRDAEADEPENPQPRCEAHREDREQEDEGVGPNACLQTEREHERLVDQVRQDGAEEDQTIVEDGGGLPREEPREAQADPQVGEEEHGRRNGTRLKRLPRQSSNHVGTLRRENGTTEPCVVGLQLRGVERLPGKGPGLPRAETEAPDAARGGDEPPDCPREPGAAGAVGSGPRRLPHAGGEGAGPPLRSHGGRGGTPRGNECLPGAIRRAGRAGEVEDRLVRPEDPRLYRAPISRVST